MTSCSLTMTVSATGGRRSNLVSTKGSPAGLPRLIGCERATEFPVRSLQDRPVPNRYRINLSRDATWAQSLSSEWSAVFPNGETLPKFKGARTNTCELEFIQYLSDTGVISN